MKARFSPLVWLGVFVIGLSIGWGVIDFIAAVVAFTNRWLVA